MRTLQALLLAASLSAPAPLRAEATEVVIRGVTVTSKALAAALAEDMKPVLALNDGWLLLQDPEAGPIRLRPEKLDSGSHLHVLEGQRLLSFGSFRNAEGDQYNLDFYYRLDGTALKMDGPATIYSVNGVARYGWDESGPAMKKLPRPDADAKAKERILRMEEKARKALLAQDREALKAVLSEAWTDTDAQGAKLGRDKFLAQLGKPSGIEESGVEVRISGQTAVVTGRSKVTGADQVPHESAFTRVYAKKFEAWKQVSSHRSAIPR